jgi:hypothetical protein|tara:strand:+ start:3732 stop:4145 length:414 start_codon:yes stop_codon:yes gene_type:complete
MQDLGKDIGKLFDAIDILRNDHNKKKSSPFAGSENEEAMDTFINKKKAEDLENELRQIIMETRGYDAWQELLKLRAEIRRKRKEAERARMLARQKLWDNLWLYGGVFIILVGISVILFFVGTALVASGTINSWLGRG